MRNPEPVIAVAVYALLLAFGVYAILVKVYKVTDVLGLFK